MSDLKPSFDSSTNTITVPDVEHVEFLIAGRPITGDVEIKRNTTVRVRAERGFVLDKSVEREHRFEVSKKETAPEAKTEEKTEEKPSETVAPEVTAGNTPGNPAQGSRVSGSTPRLP
jgi:hypothetical protein